MKVTSKGQGQGRAVLQIIEEFMCTIKTETAVINIPFLYTMF